MTIKFVIEDGVISLNNVGYHKDDVVELTPEQYERLKHLGRKVEDNEPIADKQPANVELSYDKMSKEDLERLVVERGLTPVGTGADGGVIKADLIEVLKASDAQ